MANRTTSYPSTNGRPRPQLSHLPLNMLPDDLDVYTYDDEPLVEFAFSTSHHRASERGRATAQLQEYGTLEDY